MPKFALRPLLIFLIFVIASLAAVSHAQSDPINADSGNAAPPPHNDRQQESVVPAAKTSRRVTLEPGTKVLLVMKNTISSRNARKGDGVYLESSFPVVSGGRVVIPAGTYVQGVVDEVRRSGRIKGRAEILLHFTTLIYPNGYMVSLPGALESADGNDSQAVKDKEGTIQAESTKGRDAATIATTSGTGAVVGGLSNGAKGAAVGGGLGAAVGVATAMLTRGQEVRLESGTSVEMVLQRPVGLDPDRIEGVNHDAPPVTRSKKLAPPPLVPTPGLGPNVR